MLVGWNLSLGFQNSLGTPHQAGQISSQYEAIVIVILLGNILQVLDCPCPILNSGKVSMTNHRSFVEVIKSPIERVPVKWCYILGKVQQGDHSTNQGDHATNQGDHQGPMGDHGRPWQRGHNTLCNQTITCSGHFSHKASLSKEKLSNQKFISSKQHWRLLQFCNIHLAISFFQRITRLPPFPVGRTLLIFKGCK